MQFTSSQPVRGTARRRAERGISLIFALLALVAISLAAVALVRSVDSGGLIVGNVAFKQEALASAERASEQAVTWLTPRIGVATLHADSVGAGYYATSLDNLDVTGQGSTAAARAVVDWDDDNCAAYASGSYGVCMKPRLPKVTLAGGNVATWVITRLCAQAGDPQSVGVDCAAPLVSSSGQSTAKGDYNYSKPENLVDEAFSQYYRIVVRAQGARGTVAFTETIVHY